MGLRLHATQRKVLETVLEGMDTVAPRDPERRSSGARVVGANTVRQWQEALLALLEVDEEVRVDEAAKVDGYMQTITALTTELASTTKALDDRTQDLKAALADRDQACNHLAELSRQLDRLRFLDYPKPAPRE